MQKLLVNWYAHCVENFPETDCGTKENAMTGVVTTKDLFRCAHIILRHFGPAVYMRCVTRSIFSRKPVTFLDCLR